MAAPLMSLLSPGTIKHVVPWKTRTEFLKVYSDLYSDDLSLQEKAINRIAVWKSRAGSKLSVAIESSAMLMQASLDHIKIIRDGTILQQETQLRSLYGLALIRFVNHVTEKGQTKATAQPVHLVARNFGIPEWIVRLRHDATHSSMPSLDALATGAKWALNYLRENFWRCQTKEVGHEENERSIKSPKMVAIRRAFYDFQKSRFQDINADSKDKEAGDQSESLKVLNRYLNQNRFRFVKCLLEDGILISTEEQLAALGVTSSDLLNQSPPTVPLEMVEFWRPLLKKLHAAGALLFMLHMAMFSITSGEGLRNYQLVAWIAFILSQTSASLQKKRKKKDTMFKSLTSLPTKTLLSAGLQNINRLTAHLLKYLADSESLGDENYLKLRKLLNLQTKVVEGVSSNDDTDSDTVYTVEDLKQAKLKQTQQISSSTVQDLQTSIEKNDIPWVLCTDLVDWSAVPLGVLPDVSANDDDDDDDDDTVDDESKTSKDVESTSEGSDDADDDYVETRRKGSSKRRISEHSWSPKRSKVIMKEDLTVL